MNLAKIEKRPGSLPQRTFRRETTMPRQGTDLPEAEINARIVRPNDNGAEELSQLLGLVNTTGQKFLRGVQDEKNKEDAGAASLDFASGEKDEQRFAKSWAYREAYQREGVKKLAIDISVAAKQAVEERLNNEDDPATIEDVQEALEGVFRSHVMDERGELLDFGTPEDKTLLGNAMREIQSSLIPQAVEAIKKQTDERFMATLVQNYLYERQRGAPIGAEIEVRVDPNAPPGAWKQPVPGRDYNVEDAIQELGMTAEQAEAFVKDGTLPSSTPEKPRIQVSLGRPTGRPPHPGSVTSTFAQHEKRGSAGVDIDGRYGDPIEAPAGGKVIAVGNDERSGLHVIIDHGNGITSSYSHLSAASVQKGDVLRPGTRLGLMGNSGHVVSSNGGDGSHLHWRVKVRGEDVDPLSFSFADGAATGGLPTGEGPELASSVTPREAPATIRGVDFEALMKRLPPSINRQFAKKYLLDAIVAEAVRLQDPSLLNGLELSTRADGIPSFTPDERRKIVEARDAVRNKRRADADRVERELHEANADAVLEAISSGSPPSPRWLAEQGRKGLLSDEFVYSMVNHMEAEERQELREARAEAREAAREADAEIDAAVYAEVNARRAGELSDASYEDDLRRFNAGEYGTGKKAAARLKTLQTAAKEGRKEAERDPDFARFSASLKTTYGPVKAGNGSLLSRKGGGGLDAPTFAAMMAHYRNQVHSGKSPEEAYRSAIAHYAPKGAPQKANSIRAAAEAMRARKAAELGQTGP